MIKSQESVRIPGLLSRDDRWSEAIRDFRDAFDTVVAHGGRKEPFLRNVRKALALRISQGETAAYAAVAIAGFVPFGAYGDIKPIGRMLAKLVDKDKVPANTVRLAVEHLAASYCTLSEINRLRKADDRFRDTRPSPLSVKYLLEPVNKAVPAHNELLNSFLDSAQPRDGGRTSMQVK